MQLGLEGWICNQMEEERARSFWCREQHSPKRGGCWRTDKNCGLRSGWRAGGQRLGASPGKHWGATTMTAVAICWALQVLGTISHGVLTTPPITDGETEAWMWELTCQGHTAFL